MSLEQNHQSQIQESPPPTEAIQIRSPEVHADPCSLVDEQHELQLPMQEEAPTFQEPQSTTPQNALAVEAIEVAMGQRLAPRLEDALRCQEPEFTEPEWLLGLGTLQVKRWVSLVPSGEYVHGHQEPEATEPLNMMEAPGLAIESQESRIQEPEVIAVEGPIVGLAIELDRSETPLPTRQDALCSQTRGGVGFQHPVARAASESERQEIEPRMPQDAPWLQEPAFTVLEDLKAPAPQSEKEESLLPDAAVAAMPSAKIKFDVSHAEEAMVDVGTTQDLVKHGKLPVKPVVTESQILVAGAAVSTTREQALDTAKDAPEHQGPDAAETEGPWLRAWQAVEMQECSSCAVENCDAFQACVIDGNDAEEVDDSFCASVVTRAHDGGLVVNSARAALGEHAKNCSETCEPGRPEALFSLEGTSRFEHPNIIPT